MRNMKGEKLEGLSTKIKKFMEKKKEKILRFNV